MAQNLLQRGVTDVSKQHIAQPKDNTLPSLLEEAFLLLEIRFANFGKPHCLHPLREMCLPAPCTAFGTMRLPPPARLLV